jgi:hypothetical protein
MLPEYSARDSPAPPALLLFLCHIKRGFGKVRPTRTESESEKVMRRIDRDDAESAGGLPAADTLAGTGRFRRNPLRPSETRPLWDVLWIASHTRKACDELDQFNPHKQLRNVGF